MPGVKKGLEDMEEEERERERQALIANAELQERIDAVRPGDYQLQVCVSVPRTLVLFVNDVLCGRVSDGMDQGRKPMGR